MIRATERNLTIVTDKTIIIPGHGPVGNKAGLTEFHDMLLAIRKNVAELKKQGKSLSETIAAKPTAAMTPVGSIPHDASNIYRARLFRSLVPKLTQKEQNGCQTNQRKEL